ncbi:MAG: hypothetical protein PQJ44_06195 [Sphaerochaetaceae bacterium]|nr:hypothetical protein [Sphaerochaetaceae bacterium]
MNIDSPTVIEAAFAPSTPALRLTSYLGVMFTKIQEKKKMKITMNENLYE